MGDIELLRLFSLADEFKSVVLRLLGSTRVLGSQLGLCRNWKDNGDIQMLRLFSLADELFSPIC
jgi:hypothetical protein